MENTAILPATNAEFTVRFDVFDDEVNHSFTFNAEELMPHCASAAIAAVLCAHYTRKHIEENFIPLLAGKQVENPDESAAAFLEDIKEVEKYYEDNYEEPSFDVLGDIKRISQAL